MVFKRGKRELKRIYIDGCRYNERLNTEYECLSQTELKKAKIKGKKVTLETIMSTKADKTVKKITYHVSPREIIYTKKQIEWNHEKR